MAIMTRNGRHRPHYYTDACSDTADDVDDGLDGED